MPIRLLITAIDEDAATMPGQDVFADFDRLASLNPAFRSAP